MCGLEVIILAGGLGSRLSGTIGDIPKPMAPVEGRPFLEYLFSWLEKYDVCKVILSTGYKAEMISDCFGPLYNNLPIEYAVEPEPLGTGGAILFALEKAQGDNVLIVNGDTWFPVDVGRLVLGHLETNASFTMALKSMTDFSRYGTVEMEEDVVVRFNEKHQCSEGLINGGIYVMNRFFLESYAHTERQFSFETGILEKRVTDRVIRGVVFDEPFIDIGVPEDYMRAGEVIKQKTIGK